MAHPRRIARVAKQIEREVGSLFIYDKVVQEAVCPERRRGLDGALSALASVTEVEVSNDLQVAKVFLSIYSDDVGKEAAMQGLRRLEGYVRKHVGRTVRLRLTPEIRFVMDESIERSERVMKLLQQVKDIEEGRAEPPPVVIPDDDVEGDAFAVLAGAVDLGLFDDEDEEMEVDEEEEEEAAGSASGNVPARGRVAVKGDGDEMTAKEVEEMMAYFRQESAGRNRGGGARNTTGRKGKRK
jgi:ribosome-binding factor A